MKKKTKLTKLAKSLDEFGDNTWRRRCAKETNYTYQTVLNATNGIHPNIKIMEWVRDELALKNQMFI